MTYPFAATSYGGWGSNEPQAIGQGLTEVSATQKVRLGTIVRGFHETYGEGEFIYLKGVNSTVAGSVVSYGASFQTALATTAVDAPLPLAVAMAATVGNTFGWYQIGGQASARKALASSFAAGAYVSSDTGLAEAASTGNRIEGAVVAIVSSAATAADKLHVVLMLNRPTGPGAT